MKLSQRIREKLCAHSSSDITINKLTAEVQALEDKASSWAMLERLPTHIRLVHDANTATGPQWRIDNFLTDKSWLGSTPEAALRNYWK